ncbi:MAG: aromatic ring-hydroxylating dioxygenase subunit alpha [Rhodospirillaceae bacterium]|nr:aromatic ring-hydroxylating dioxygenase subunit alpha [Rhodospirillaceae bacterium]
MARIERGTVTHAAKSEDSSRATALDGTALDNEAYVSAEFFDSEVKKIFRATWMLAGFAHEVSDAGDSLPVTIGGIPMILVRGRDGEVRAFHNVCVHRGMPLIDKPCRKRAFITCPYHLWTYDLEGRVRNRPHFFRGGEHDISENGRDDVRLAAIRCDSWHDLVFVNLDGKAEPLADFLRPLTERLQHYDLDALNWSRDVEYDIASNWKLIAENHIDALHIFGVHPALNKFADQATRPCTEAFGHLFFGCYSFPDPEKGRGLGMPYFPGLSAKARQEAPWFYLFPNVMGQVYPDQLLVIQLIPESHERTRERVHFYFVGDAAHDDAFEEGRRQAHETYTSVLAEDIPVCEALQRGRVSEGFTGGVLSPFWDKATFELAERVRERLG